VIPPGLTYRQYLGLWWRRNEAKDEKLAEWAKLIIRLFPGK